MIKKMDKEKFQEDLKASLPLISQELSVDAKTDKYHIILNSTMDKLALLKKKRIKKDMKQPWYDEQLSNKIQLRHLRERKWKHSGDEYDYIALQYQEKHVTKIIHANQKNSNSMTYSGTSAKIPKGYIQRRTNYYFKRKDYPYLMKKIQKYWLKDSTSSSHQRLKRLWQLWFLQIHIQLMNPT